MHVHQPPTSALLDGLQCVIALCCLAADTPTLKLASLMGSTDLERQAATGMVLPFDPLALSFHDLNYYVPLPLVSGWTMCCACWLSCSPYKCICLGVETTSAHVVITASDQPINLCTSRRMKAVLKSRAGRGRRPGGDGTHRRV